MTTSPTSSTTGTDAPFRTPGLLCAVGGIAFVVLGIVGIVLGDDGLTRVGRIDLWLAVAAVAVVLTGFGIVAAARLGRVARGTLGRIGLGVALLGTAVFAVAHALGAVVPGQDETPLLPVGQLIATIGMIVLGVAVLRRGAWAGAGRVTPLLCGLYPVLILFPAFAIFGAPNFPAIAGFGLVWALLGGAVATAPLSSPPR